MRARSGGGSDVGPPAPPPLVGGVDRLASVLVDQLLAQPVAGSPVDLPEGDPLA
jgi:hypothetical protein